MLAYRDVFRMHLMSLYLFTFYGLESACPYMQSQFLTVNSPFVQCCQYSLRKMKPCGGSGNGTFYLGVNRLISLLVTFLRFTVQIGGNGQFAYRFQQVGEGDCLIIP